MKSPSASKREVRTALHVASNTGQALSECVEAIRRLAETGEGLAGIVTQHQEQISAMQAREDAFYARGVVGRLCWLVLGR